MDDGDVRTKIKNEPKSIKLPDSIEMFGNLKNAKRFAIDIGKFLTIYYYPAFIFELLIVNDEFT